MARPTPINNNSNRVIWRCSWLSFSSAASRWSSSRSSLITITMTMLWMMIRTIRSVMPDMPIMWDRMPLLMVDNREVRHHSTEWFQRRFSTPAVGEDHSRSNGSIMASESAQVRDFIERLVESLVAGGLDRVNINRLYSHPDYERMFSIYHDTLCDVLARLSFALQMAIANKPLDESDSPSAAHTELKQLIQSIIQEAMTLPSMQQGVSKGSTISDIIADDVNHKTYEDILATAILNKVIERFQQYGFKAADTEIDRNSNLLYKTQDMDHQRSFISSMEIGTSETLTSSSSLDDTSWSETSHADPSSLTIEECIEEEEEVVIYDSSEDGDFDQGDTTKRTELDFYLSGLNFVKKHRVPFPELGMDIVDGNDEQEDVEGNTSPQPTDLISPVDSWEENWLFQRRKLKAGGSNQPMSVPMLVPNPSEEYRALIGDQDAEETSDLSDCSDSIYEDITEERQEETSLSPLVTASKQEAVQKISDLDEYSTLTSVTEIAEARNVEITNLDSLSEFGQQDSEYTEDYASNTQRQMNSLMRKHGIECMPSPVPKPRTVTVTDNVASAVTIEDNLAIPPRPGTIAEREHKKWESAPPIRNNPYSSENILKRVNKSNLLDIRTKCQEKIELPDNEVYEPKVGNSLPYQSNTNISRYGRDYYVNASQPTSAYNGQSFCRPVEIIMSPSAEEIVSSSKTKQITQSLPNVSNEVTRWQKEINQREELWMKKINNNSDTNLKIVKLKTALNQKKEAEPAKNGVPNNAFANKNIIIVEKQNDTFLKKQSPAITEKTILKLENNSKYSNNSIKDIVIVEKQVDTLLKKQKNDFSEQMPKFENNSTCTNLNGVLNVHNNRKNIGSELVTRMPNGNLIVDHEENSSKGNGKVQLSENDKSATNDKKQKDQLISMPSVRDLAKQFSSRTEINVSPSKSPSPVNRTTKRESLGVPTNKALSNGAALSASLPIREVHSLTARSISREFREELKRNVPAHLSRNKNDDSRPTMLTVSSSATTTPVYTSDESERASPIPGSLRTNIAFWEQLQQNK